MIIEVQTSKDIDSKEWATYQASFNKVFGKDNTIKYFNKKYLNTIDDKSYHVFLKENNVIGGACTCIPFEYFIADKKYRIGLMVDVFIEEKFRKDPLFLFRMYNKLKISLIQNKIDCTIAVPNENSYSYWTNIVKWKYIGDIPYHILPVNVGNIFGIKFKGVFNFLSNLYCRVSLLFIYGNSVQEKSCVELYRSNSFENHRYFEFHIRKEIDTTVFHYRIINENGIETCYLIDFYNKKNQYRRDTESLKLAIKYLLKYEKNIHLIVFVGTRLIPQSPFIKLAKKNEPKQLHLVFDNFSLNDKVVEKISNIKNWDFGLINYDVR